jgi:bacterioferritin (cytochrome b1)
MGFIVENQTMRERIMRKPKILFLEEHPNFTEADFKKLYSQNFERIMEHPIRREIVTYKKQLENLTNVMIDDIIDMSDEEIIREVIEDGKDPKEETDKIREIINDAKEEIKKI